MNGIPSEPIKLDLSYVVYPDEIVGPCTSANISAKAKICAVKEKEGEAEVIFHYLAS